MFIPSLVCTAGGRQLAELAGAQSDLHCTHSVREAEGIVARCRIVPRHQAAPEDVEALSAAVDQEAGMISVTDAAADHPAHRSGK